MVDNLDLPKSRQIQRARRDNAMFNEVANHRIKENPKLTPGHSLSQRAKDAIYKEYKRQVPIVAGGRPSVEMEDNLEKPSLAQLMYGGNDKRDLNHVSFFPAAIREDSEIMNSPEVKSRQTATRRKLLSNNAPVMIKADVTQGVKGSGKSEKQIVREQEKVYNRYANNPASKEYHQTDYTGHVITGGKTPKIERQKRAPTAWQTKVSSYMAKHKCTLGEAAKALKKK